MHFKLPLSFKGFLSLRTWLYCGKHIGQKLF